MRRFELNFRELKIDDVLESIVEDLTRPIVKDNFKTRLLEGETLDNVVISIPLPVALEVKIAKRAWTSVCSPLENKVVALTSDCEFENAILPGIKVSGVERNDHMRQLLTAGTVGCGALLGLFTLVPKVSEALWERTP